MWTAVSDGWERMGVPGGLGGRGWSWGATARVALATVGLGLNLRAWVLLGPRLAQRPDVGLVRYVALMAVPLLVAALARLPVGVLTDRYGARVTFPAVSLVAAASVFGLALTDSLPIVVVAGGTAGVAGTAFVVGAALVSRTVGYGRRGLALGVFGLGTAVAVGISAVSWAVDPGGRRSALVLGATLVSFAGLAAVVLRDHGGEQGRGYRGSPLRRCVQMVRLASVTSLSLLYALALGGVVAVAVYLPAYLAAVFSLGWFRALSVTVAVVVLAAAGRLVGGWWTDRRPTAGLLVVSYGVAAALCLAVAVAPRRWWVIVALIAAVAVCDGLASGALLALIGKAARADSVGAVMGVTGSAAAFGALAVSLLLAGVDRLSGSPMAGWLLLATILLAVAWYVRAHGLRIGLGLAVQSDHDPGPAAVTPAAVTVAVVGEPDTRWGAAAVVARLAELATRDELVVIYGSDDPAARPRRDTNVLVTGLRERLPRHRIVAIRVAPHAGSLEGLGRDAARFGEFVATGAVAIALTPMQELGGVAAHLSTYLRADRVLKVSYALSTGAHLHKVWDRRVLPTTADP